MRHRHGDYEKENEPHEVFVDFRAHGRTDINIKWRAKLLVQVMEQDLSDLLDEHELRYENGLCFPSPLPHCSSLRRPYSKALTDEGTW